MKLNELTTVEALDGLKQKKFSSIELTQACLDQIEKYDSKIKAFVTVTNSGALECARKADEIISKTGESSFDQKPLLGIPYAVKDNFSTKGVETTASSNILKGYIPQFESTVTRKLAEAGAVLLGKTNMDAFAHGASTENSDFYTTKNPWDIKRLPGGSSGGSAAAVGSNMCIFAIGSDTGGSIRCPASWTGTTGLKPTYGRVSRYGVIAMASSTDSPGPMTKSATDAYLVLSVISGKDPLDATSSTVSPRGLFNVENEGSISGKRIGVARSFFEMDIDSQVRKTVEDAISVFEKLGAKISDIELLHPKYSIAVYTVLQRSEVSSNLARFDGIRYGHTREKFGDEAIKRMMFGAYSLSAGYYDAYYSKAQKVRTLIIENFNKVFDEVDLIVGPTMPTIADKVGASEGQAIYGEIVDVLQEPSSIAGIAAVSVPCGFSEELPIGMQIMSNYFCEPELLSAASTFQKNTNFHAKIPNLEETTKGK